MQAKIAAGLEQAFATRGFAEPSVEDLRDATGVSLRTLYKYAPSRDAMTRIALEFRHQRYIRHVFGDSSDTGQQSLSVTLDRIAEWMRIEASHGCLFHAAVAASPGDTAMRALLGRHKSDVSRLAVARSGLHGRETDVLMIIEGLTQTWPLSGPTALQSAKGLASLISKDSD